MAASISVLIYTRNNVEHISESIDSAGLLTKNILVIDQSSTDGTPTIAKQKGVRVVSIPHAEYVELVRMSGIEKVSSDWIFILDADERITEELAEEIHRRIKDEKITSYKVPRKNIFARKKWLKHGGWYPDYQTRLINRSALKEWPAVIHSTPRINGQEGHLTNPMLHYFHGDLESMVSKTTKYEMIEAALLFAAKRESGTTVFFRKFLGELNRRLIMQSGWRDGIPGIIESFYQAYSKTVTYLYLYEKQTA